MKRVGRSGAVLRMAPNDERDGVRVRTAVRPSAADH
jgi:hypothetical protein